MKSIRLNCAQSGIRKFRLLKVVLMETHINSKIPHKKYMVFAHYAAIIDHVQCLNFKGTSPTRRQREATEKIKRFGHILRDSMFRPLGNLNITATQDYLMGKGMHSVRA